MCNLSNPIYHDKDKAREHLEAIRWPDGPICPHCGVVDNAAELRGKAHRPGVYKCRDCRKQFSVTVGTVFERSKVPLNKWLLATQVEQDPSLPNNDEIFVYFSSDLLKDAQEAHDCLRAIGQLSWLLRSKGIRRDELYAELASLLPT